jgi:hypothetical protein
MLAKLVMLGTGDDTEFMMVGDADALRTIGAAFTAAADAGPGGTERTAEIPDANTGEVIRLRVVLLPEIPDE